MALFNDLLDKPEAPTGLFNDLIDQPPQQQAMPGDPLAGFTPQLMQNSMLDRDAEQLKVARDVLVQPDMQWKPEDIQLTQEIISAYPDLFDQQEKSIATMKRIEAHQNKLKEKGKYDFWESQGVQKKDGLPLDKIPFIGIKKNFDKFVDINEITKKVEKGTATWKQMQRYAEYQEHEMDKANMSTGAKIVDVMTDMPAYAGEFLATGGLYAAGKKATHKAGVALFKRNITNKFVKGSIKAAGAVGGSLPRTLAMPHRVLESASGKALSGDGTGKALAKGFADTYIENISEVSGKGLKVIGRKLFKVIPKGSKLGKVISKMSDSQIGTRLRDGAKKLGYNGPLEEMGEERVGDLIRASFGLGDWKDVIPDKEQVIVEGVAFSLPSLGMSSVAKTAEFRENWINKKYPGRFEIADQKEFKAKALTPEGAMQIAALNPHTAGEIAGKEQPSRADMKKLGATGWNAQERQKFAGLLKEATSSQQEFEFARRDMEKAIEDHQAKLEEVEQLPMDQLSYWSEQGYDYAQQELQKRQDHQNNRPLGVLAYEEEHIKNLQNSLADEDGYKTAPVESYEQGNALADKLAKRAEEIGENVEIVVEADKIKVRPIQAEPGKEADRSTEAPTAQSTAQPTAQQSDMSDRQEMPDLAEYSLEDLEDTEKTVKGDPELADFHKHLLSELEKRRKQSDKGVNSVMGKKDSVKKKSTGVKEPATRESFREKLEKTGVADYQGATYKVVSNDNGGYYVRKEENGFRFEKGPGPFENWGIEYAIDKAETEAFGQAEPPKPKKSTGVKDLSGKFIELADKVSEHMQSTGQALDNRKVNEFAKEVFGSAAGNARNAYDAFEAGMNQHIAKLGAEKLEFDNPQEAIKALLNIENMMPTQTRRDETQVEMQQFSTPPAEAYVAVRAAAIQPGMEVLEPSAGTGNIATIAKLFGGNVTTNEIDQRRRTLLKNMGYEVLGVDAEYLDNMLDPDLMYDVIAMNPPFSATGGRVKGHNTKFGAKHVEQALLRLKKGGRLVAIVGQGMALDRPNFRSWWEKTEKKYNVRANIGIDGNTYKKFGTTFGNQIIVIDNDGPTASESDIITGENLSPVEANELLNSLAKENVYDKIRKANPTASEKAGTGKGTNAQQSADSAADNPASNRGRKSRGTRTTADNRDRMDDVLGDSESGGVSKRDNREGKNRTAPAAGQTKDVGSGIDHPSVRGVKKHLTEKEQAEYDEILKTIRAKISRSNVGIDPTLVLDGVKLGRFYLKAGYRSFKQWANDVMEVVGDEKFRPYLPKIWNTLQERYPEYNLDQAVEQQQSKPDESVQVNENAGMELEESQVEEGTVYSTYQVRKAKVKGSQPHPANIVESTVMATVEPPDVKYKHHLPAEVIQEGRISDLQLEALIYAGQAHQVTLPSGEAAGFWIGDGTGLGKGREIYSIIYDNYMQGRKKAVHLSIGHQLRADAERDAQGVGLPMKVIHQKDFDNTEDIQDEGVFFSTYGLMAEGWDKGRERFQQLLDWLGEDFDGVIAFDEAHKMKNAAQSDRGGNTSTANGTNVGDMGIALQRAFPKAKIVYVSATGASEARHLVPYERLGLWGPGMPFDNFISFTNAMQKGGVSAMETLSRDLKAIGRLLARTISYKGVEYDPIKHELSAAERKQFDEIAEFWDKLNAEFDEANKNASQKAKSHFSSFYMAQQNFFLQLMMGYELPSVINSIENDLAEGRSVVINLFNTGEAVANRIIGNAIANGVSLDEIELSPRQMLVDLVRNAFPIHQWQEVSDGNGKTKLEPMLDKAGNPIINRENLRKRDELIEEISEMNLPTNPLDAIMDHFGAENVAEITGRSQRMEKGKYVKRKIKGVKKDRLNEYETELFQNGKKRIAIISGAGATGISLHADKTKKNKQRRVFYGLQLSWSADTQMQSFGRVHRSFQDSPPIIRLVTCDLSGQNRLINAISKRLAALGAITKGERSSLSGSMFNAEDLTDTYGKAALQETYHQLLDGKFNDESIGRSLVARMGLLNSKGDVSKANLEDVDRFLNRIMALPYKMQNRVFDIFYENFQNAVMKAKESGAFDFGVEEIKAKNLKQTADPVTVYTHEASGAQTKIYEFEGEIEIDKITFDQALKNYGSWGFYKNKISGKIYAVSQNENPTATASNAIHLRNIKRGLHSVSMADLREKYEQVQQAEARQWWNSEFDNTPNTQTKKYTMLSGVIFPIYDKIMGKSELSNTRMRRAALADGRSYVGLELNSNEAIQVKQRFGIGSKIAEMNSDELLAMLDDGAVLEVDNGWQLKKSRISDDQVIELLPKDSKSEGETLSNFGFTSEIIHYKKRWFVLRRGAKKVVDNLLKDHKVIRDITSQDMKIPSSKHATIGDELLEKPNSVKSTGVKKEKQNFDLVDDLLKFASPAHRNDQSRSGGHTLRENFSKRAQKLEAARYQLKKAHRKFRFMSKENVLDFIDNMENGRQQLDPELETISLKMREILDTRREQIRGLGKGMLESYYEHYFPHIWKNPKNAKAKIAQLLANRPLEGSKSFLKKRTIVTIKEGIEQGLELESDNPVDLVLLKVQEIDRFLMAHDIIKDLKEKGMLQYVYAKAKAPEGLVRINDKAFDVFMPPEMTVKEAFDKQLMDNLTDFAASIGISLQRKTAIGGKGRWGYANDNKVVTKFAGPESILMHEIGHVLGNRYGLYDMMIKKGLEGEMQALAMARTEGLDDKALEQYAVKRDEQEAVMLQAYLHAPAKFEEVAPKLYTEFEKFLNSHNELRPLMDIKPSLVHDVAENKLKVPGVTKLGSYMAPEPVARLLNNFLSPGLRNNNNKSLSLSYDMLRKMGNILNQVNLSFSLFHALNTGSDVMASHVGLGLREILSKGQRTRGVKHLAEVPVSPAINLWRGRKLIKEWRKDLDKITDPQMKMYVETLIKAGGRATMDAYYYNDAVSAFNKTLSDIVRGAPLTKAKGVAKLPVNLLGSLVELSAKPVMQWWVPRQKLGLFMVMAQHEMDRARTQNLSDFQLQERLTQVWDSIDNRMGQLVYDNLFWNKVLKDSSMLAVRAVGWNLGSWREYGGAVSDIATTKQRQERGDMWLSHKMGYTIGAFALVYPMMGATVQYILTGSGPDELLDFYFPKTGHKNADGSDERLSLPTYAKDVFSYTLSPLKTAQHKLHPMWNIIAELKQNQDFYGTEIRDTDDPLVVQMKQTAEYLGEQFLPFSVRSYMKLRRTGNQPVEAAVTSITGINAAPASITRSPAQKLMMDFTIARLPKGKREKEDFERSRLKKDYVRKLREGKEVDWTEINSKFTYNEVRSIKRAAGREPFAHSYNALSAEQAMKVYMVANDQERYQVKSMLVDKYLRMGDIEHWPMMEEMLKADQKAARSGKKAPNLAVVKREALEALRKSAPSRRSGEHPKKYSEKIQQWQQGKKKASRLLKYL